MLLARYTNWNRPCMIFWTRFGLQGTKVGNDAILYPLGLLSAGRIVIGLLLPLQHCPCLPAFY